MITIKGTPDFYHKANPRLRINQNDALLLDKEINHADSIIFNGDDYHVTRDQRPGRYRISISSLPFLKNVQLGEQVEMSLEGNILTLAHSVAKDLHRSQIADGSSDPRVNQWVAYDTYKQFIQPKTKPNPRRQPLVVKRKQRFTDRTDPNATVPEYARYGMKVAINWVCPVLGLREGSYVQLGDSIYRVLLVIDHIIPRSDGGRTNPDNIRMISNIANGFKLDSNMSDEAVRERFKESGYEPYCMPDDDGTVLVRYKVTVCSTPDLAVAA